MLTHTVEQGPYRTLRKLTSSGYMNSLDHFKGFINPLTKVYCVPDKEQR